MFEFNYLNLDEDSSEFPDLCLDVHDYLEVESGELSLIDADEVVSESEELTIHVTYPCAKNAYVTVESAGGFTLLRLMEAIFESYVLVYDKKFTKRKLGCLFLEGADILADGIVEIHIGT